MRKSFNKKRSRSNNKPIRIKILKFENNLWICEFEGKKVYMPSEEYVKVEKSEERQYINKDINVLITNVNEGKICVSRKKYLEQKARTESLIRRLVIGQHLEGIISGRDKKFLYVNTLSITTLLPLTQAVNPEKIKKDREIHVEIIKIDIKGRKVYVSEKAFIKTEEFYRGMISEISSVKAVVEDIQFDYVSIRLDNDRKGIILRKDLNIDSNVQPWDILYTGEPIEPIFISYNNGTAYFMLPGSNIVEYSPRLFEYTTEQILSEVFKIEHNHFYAKIIELNSNTRGGFLATSLIAPEDDGRLLCNPETGSPINVLIDGPIQLNANTYYEISIELAVKHKRQDQNNPYLFLAIPCSQIEQDPYKEIVECAFSLCDNPKSNRDSAKLLKEIGQDMYTGKDRMFYELLQNADDASGEEGVRMSCQVMDNYLIISHDGMPFSQEDFTSITSAANSAKRSSRKKTGYKGIGFKSVFTSSDKVYIKSGGFFFCFDKTAPIFSDFKSFYKKTQGFETDEDYEKWVKKFKLYETEFETEKVNHIPWQLIPFWVDQCPEDLNKSLFRKQNNVSIALNMDSVKTEQYEETIMKIMHEPRFMLFLRNTKRIQLKDKGNEIFTISKDRNEDGELSIKTSFINNDELTTFYQKDGGLIDVCNQNFKDCGIPLEKEEIDGRFKIYERKNDNERTEITSIPERVIAADTTNFSYAFPLDERGRITSLPKGRNSLYAFLPMQDYRFIFPFYINGDFVLSSNRELVSAGDLWNHFLFFNLGKSIPSWVAEVAKACNPKYLNLLPLHKLNESHEDISKLASYFNGAYSQALVETPFILNCEGRVACQKDIFTEETGLSSIIGEKLFCTLWGTEKRLPHPDIESNVLHHEIFTEIEHWEVKKVLNDIFMPERTRMVLRCFYYCKKRTALIAKLIDLSKTSKIVSKNILDIPVFEQGKFKVFSYNRLMKVSYQNGKLAKSSKYILNLPCFEPAYNIFLKLGICMVRYDETHPFSSIVASHKIEYILHVFEIIRIITSQAENALLNSNDRVTLFSLFAAKEMEIESDALRKWILFRNQEGIPSPLTKLTLINSSLYNNITSKYVLNDEDSNADKKKLIEQYIMKEKCQFKDIVEAEWDNFVSTVGTDETKALSLYQLATVTYEAAKHESEKQDAHSTIFAKNFIFVNGSMQPSNKVIINSEIGTEKEVKRLIESATTKNIPSAAVCKALKSNPFNMQEVPLEKVCFSSEKTYSKDDINSLLKFCQYHSDTIFKTHFIHRNDDNTYLIKSKSASDKVVYTDDQQLGTLLLSLAEYKQLPAEFSDYSSLECILVDDDLLLSVFETVKDTKPHQEILFPLVEESVSKVKKSFIEHYSTIVMGEDSCTFEDNYDFRIFKLATTIEKPDAAFYDDLRGKIKISYENKQFNLSDIKLKHAVVVGQKSFPLSMLVPDEDKLAGLVETVRERLFSLPSIFLTKLFVEEIGDNSAQEIYQKLSRAAVTLTNGAQAAFVLEYFKVNHKQGASVPACLVTDRAEKPRSLMRSWYTLSDSFIKDSMIMGGNYEDVNKYLSLPYSIKVGFSSFELNTLFTNYEDVETSLSEQQKLDLLNHLLVKYRNQNLKLGNQISTVKNRLGMDAVVYVIPKKFSLDEERLPSYVENWRLEEPIERDAFLSNVLAAIPENSDVVNVRRFLETSEPFKISESYTYNISGLTCNWISQKNIVLSDEKYSLVKTVIKNTDITTKADEAFLEGNITAERKLFSFANYTIYYIDGQIPWHVSIASTKHIFHSYREGDVYLLGDIIYINKDNEDSIRDLVKSLVASGQLSSNDYFEFDSAFSTYISGELVGLIDDDPDEDLINSINSVSVEEAKEWLQARGYSVSVSNADYAFVNALEAEKNKCKYYVLVKSYKNRTKGLKINPNEWLYLLNPNSKLMIHISHLNFAVIDRKTLLSNHDFLTLRIKAANFDEDADLLDNSLQSISQVIRFFERTHFVFKNVNESILQPTESLNELGLYDNNPADVITSGTTDDIL